MRDPTAGPTATMEIASMVPLLATLLCATVIQSGQPTAPTEPHAGKVDSTTSAPPALLLIDDTFVPRVELSWDTTSGDPVRLRGERHYGIDAERTELGDNVTCYVAVGGTRIGKGAGHPRGAVVRVGFYKIDSSKAFFRGLGAGGEVRVQLTNVGFNQPVDVYDGTIVQHLKYAPEDLESCGMPGDARDQFTTVDPDETLNDRIAPGDDTRAGGLSGQDGSLGSASLTRENDGTVTLNARFRYPAMRHLADPWQSDLPGTFLEPVHFHVEFEVLPQGVEPLDLETLRAEKRARDAELDSADERPPTSAED